MPSTFVFHENSSGLDFFNGSLYAIDNGSACFWVLEVLPDGSLRQTSEYPNGRQILFPDQQTEPDSEGITVDSDGFVFIASESGTDPATHSCNFVLMVDPTKPGTILPAQQIWDLTPSLPKTRPNKGIEAIEWVPYDCVDHLLFDQNTKTLFNPSQYQNAISDGIFFLALEDNGYIYAYILNQDGSSIQISHIDSKLGGAMALDYDITSNVLWIIADDGSQNKSAIISFNGTQKPDLIHLKPPIGINPSSNTEGFAIATTLNLQSGEIPVYRFCDGPVLESLSLGSIYDNYIEHLSFGEPH